MSMDRVDRAVELLFRLSVFGFSQLCASDQRQEIEEIHNKLVHQGVAGLEKPPEESEEDFRVNTFTDLFHKLPFHEHDLFLSRVIKKFKRERQLGELISWFSTQLDANDQQEVIGKIVDATAVHDERTNEDFRLRRFAQLSQNYTEYVYKLLVPWMEDHIKKRRGTQDTTSEKETTSDWQSRFAEFYLAFSTVWFKGQTADSQRWLIEYPNSGGVKGTDTVSVIYRKLWYSTDEDFRLREFSDLLSKKILSFGTQLRLLDTVEQELRYRTSLPRGMNLQTDLSGHAAAELISHLLTFGFSLQSAADQQKKIEVLSVEVGAVYIERLAEESEGDFRIRTLTSLTAKAIFFSRADLLFDVSKKFFCERKLSDLTVLIRKSGSNGHKHLMEQLFDWLTETYYSSKYAKDVIIQKFFEENEEEFMLRRFLKLCTTHPSLWDCQEVEKWELTSMLQTKSGNADTKDIRCESVSVPPNNFSSRYAEFYLGLSIIWFKTRCANEPRNPIEVLLGEVEGDTIEKLRGESEEDFRFRRFVESFKQLLFSSQEYMVEYILKTLLDNLVEYSKLFPDAEAAYAYAYWIHEDFPFGVQFMKR